MNFSEEIEKIRINNKLTKAQMSRRLDVSAQLYGQYALGRQQPKAKVFMKIKEEFGIDLLQRNVYNNSKQNQSDFIKIKSDLEELGYDDSPAMLTSDQRDTLLLTIASHTPAIIEGLAMILSEIKNEPIEKPRKKLLAVTEDKYKKVQDAMAVINS